MLSYNIKTFDDAEKLVRLCRSYQDDIDVLHGRYIIDGKSSLGVLSLVGHVVGIDISHFENVDEADDFKIKLNEL